jgi:hypothetical protein
MNTGIMVVGYRLSNFAAKKLCRLVIWTDQTEMTNNKSNNYQKSMGAN